MSRLPDNASVSNFIASHTASRGNGPLIFEPSITTARSTFLEASEFGLNCGFCVKRDDGSVPAREGLLDRITTSRRDRFQVCGSGPVSLLSCNNIERRRKRLVPFVNYDVPK